MTIQKAQEKMPLQGMWATVAHEVKREQIPLHPSPSLCPWARHLTLNSHAATHWCMNMFVNR